MVVVLGAGASLGSGEYTGHYIPPLTLDLFKEEAYENLLQGYDLAHQAGRFIGRQLTQNTALALEQILHDLRSSNHDHHRHMAMAVPPYLQHLLHTVSEHRYRQAFRFDHLIERLLCLPYVYFITLNYDLLLDRRLSNYGRLASMSDYIADDRNWSLIKLHGSVNWYWKTLKPFQPMRPPSNLGWEDEIHTSPPTASLDDIRDMGGNTTWRYPALALPEGPDDRLVLPSRHANFISRSLAEVHQFDLLVIGYSGLDQQVLELLNQRRSDIRRMTIVNRDYQTAIEVNERLLKGGLEAVWPEVINKSFAAWMDSGDFDSLVDEFDGPYPALTG